MEKAKNIPDAKVPTSVRVDEAYAKELAKLAKQQKGYLGIESARNEIGITVSYWENIASIINWKNNFEHTIAREKGRAIWYKNYQVRICKVERDYGFSK